MQNIQEIEKKIIESIENINQIKGLLNILIQNEQLKTIDVALNSLRKIFKYYIYKVGLIKFKEMGSLDLADTRRKEVSVFLMNKFKAFLEIMYSQCISPNLRIATKLSYLRNYIEYAKYHCENSEKKGKLSDEPIFKKWCQILVESDKLYTKKEKIQIVELFEEYIQNYWDVRLGYIIYITESIGQQEQQQIKNMIQLMKIFQISVYDYQSLVSQSKSGKRKQKSKDGDEDEDGTNDDLLVQQSQAEKMEFNRLVTRLSPILNQENQIEFLKIINKYVFSNVDSPVFFSDYLTDLFNKSENKDIQLLALGSLFVLITRYQLEYPNYYSKLYQLLGSADILRNKFSGRFVSLLEASLNSSKLSLQYQTAFIKKLLRISFECDVSIQYWTVALTINMIKKNGTLMYMVNSKKDSRLIDLFEDHEGLETVNSTRSQLFELVSYKNHYDQGLVDMINLLYNQIENINFFELDAMVGLKNTTLFEIAMEKLGKIDGDDIEFEDEPRYQKVPLLSKQLIK